MLLNFCDPRLKTEVYCSAIHTEGYEATNLITGSSKGFLAYSCIRPPVNIDFTFVCNVQIHYVLLWPTVGSQRSTGFQLYAKTTTDSTTPYTMLASGCLKPNDTGLLFHSTKIDANSILAPATFLKRYVPARMECLMNYTNSLRVCISRTENSVPALGRIEIWGTVSPRCGKDMLANVYALWMNSNKPPPSKIIPTNSTSSTEATHSRGHKVPSSLEIPENFLDAITCEIMTQPIILPSGKIIDQTTLDKYEANEAIWGRSPSDPFTGLPFTEKRRPIIAVVLKAKIDKFLVDNSNAEEVKRIPRVLGHAKLSYDIDTITAVASSKPAIENEASKTNPESNCLPSKSESYKINCDSREQMSSVKIKRAHRLPVVAIRDKRTSSLVSAPKRIKTLNSSTDISQHEHDNNASESPDETCTSNAAVENDLNAAVKNVLSTLKHFSAPKECDEKSIPRTCNCCRNAVFYKLPCAHIVCRKVLTSTNHFKCKVCDKPCVPRDIERIYN